MKRKQNGEAELGEILFLGIAALVMMVVAAVFNKVECGARWSNSGVDTSWGPIQGCLVRMPSGRWVPEDRVRDVDLGAAKREAESK